MEALPNSRPNRMNNSSEGSPERSLRIRPDFFIARERAASSYGIQVLAGALAMDGIPLSEWEFEE
jgi:hypothetical protein